MVAYNKFNSMVEYLADKIFDFIGSPPGDTFKVGLSNTAPAATNTIYGNITEIAAGNGYTAGGDALTNPAGTRSGGTVTFAADQNVWTGSGAGMATFQYVVLYDDTPSSPVDPLIGWWDHGSGITLNSGDTFTWKPNNQASGGTIFTLA